MKRKIDNSLFGLNNKKSHQDVFSDQGIGYYVVLLILTLGVLASIKKIPDNIFYIIGVGIFGFLIYIIIWTLKSCWYIPGHINPDYDVVYYRTIGSYKKGFFPYSAIESISESIEDGPNVYVKKVKYLLIKLDKEYPPMKLKDNTLKITSHFQRYVELRKKIITKVPKDVLSKELWQYLDDE